MGGYHQLIMEGSRELLRAFLAGVSAGAGWEWRVRFHSECGMRDEGYGHKLLERLGLERDLTYVLVPAERVAQIAGACERARLEAGLRIAVHEARAVLEAMLPYTFTVYEREIAARLRALLDAPAGGVRIEDALAEEEGEPLARGVESPEPAPDYIFKGRGRARGPIDAILELRESLRAIESVELEAIELETEPQE
ncbi:MAG: hypothetical protein FJY75_10055 [Candidatus Eisenbacteria bacterium]|uniref:Uncharacterized protein n=1 Tax=Eiseniibacteriota bacterium TaxID=2212470 RepID=A0A937XD90_UNCEI|nr:hypothetical protein [Candidatus Eisenbacteria bacterium]